MSQIDWKTELKKVERAFDGLPPEPTPAEKRAKQAAEQREQQRKRERAALIGGWARLALVMALGVATNFWPYEHGCGVGLYAFLGAEVLIVAGGVWVAIVSFRERLPKTHALSLLVGLWGLALLELEVLPRVGYAKQAATWDCVAPAATATP